jgi:uncharacterized phage protein gp47/JayE
VTYPVGSQAYPTAVEIRDQILRDLGYHGARNGLTYNTRPGSDYYKLATALANRVAIAIANNQISNDQRNPLLAAGTNLREIARVYGIEPRPASRSAGLATVSVTTSTSIPAGWQATAGNGLKYQVQSTQTVTNGQQILIASVGTGFATRLPFGSQLTWDSAAIATLLNPLVVSSLGGITGGFDEDDDEDIRRRLVDRLAAQAVGGNGASIKAWSEEISAGIQAGFVYEALRGPGSFDFAITREDGDRTVDGQLVIQSTANVIANMPGGVVSINGTTVDPEEIDVIFAARLPLPEAAGGTGGGWIDASPFPDQIVRVLSTFGALVTIDAATEPQVGQTIGLWDGTVDPPVMKMFQILTVDGSPGNFDITLNGATSFVDPDDILSAGADNLVAYAALARDEFLALGPGEKTDNVDILPRALRYPRPEVSFPYDVTSKQITAVQAAFFEISDLSYAGVFEEGTGVTRLSPSLPMTTAEPPKQLVARRIAFIRKI